MDEPKTSGVRFPPPLIVLGFLGAGYVVHRVLPKSIAGAHVTLLRAAGGILVIAAVTLASSAIVAFRKFGTSPIPTRPTTALVETGPYRFTRNPMYVSMVLLGLGVSLLTNSWWMVVSALGAALALNFLVIAKEERYLGAMFGDAYRNYTARVRRWI